MVSKREVRRERWLAELPSLAKPAPGGAPVRVAVRRDAYDDVLHVAGKVLVGPRVTPRWVRRDGSGVAVDDVDANRAEGWLDGYPADGLQRFRPPVDAEPDADELRFALDLAADLVRSGRARFDDSLPARFREFGVSRLLLPPEIDVVRFIGVEAEQNPASQGRLAPEYVFVTRQRVHPGEDPSALPPGVGPVQQPGPGGSEAPVRVAILDTGVPFADQPSQDDYLPGVTGAGLDDPLEDPGTKVEPVNAPEGSLLLGPAAGHGSFVAGLVKRVAPTAEVRLIGVAGADGWVDEVSLVSELWKAVDPQAPEGFRANIVNLSLGGYSAVVTVGGGPPADGEAPPAGGAPPAAVTPPDDGAAPEGAAPPRMYWQDPILLGGEVARVLATGAAVVAAAGNDDSTDQELPAAFVGVVGVAALNADGQRWEHSNRGPYVRAAALGANVRGWYVQGVENQFLVPGEPADLFTDTEANFAAWSGTSMATALVSGYLANQVASGAFPGQTPRQVADTIAPPRPEGSTWELGTFIPVGLPDQPAPPGWPPPP